MELMSYAIYDSPTDYPGEFVIRQWISKSNGTFFPGDLIARCATLDAAREALPDGLTCIGREPGDDPKIVEVWL